MITPFNVSEMPYWLYIGYYTTYFVCIYMDAVLIYITISTQMTKRAVIYY